MVKEEVWIEMAKIFQTAPRGFDTQDPIFQTQSISSAGSGNEKPEHMDSAARTVFLSLLIALGQNLKMNLG